MPSVTPEFVGFMGLASNPMAYMPPLYSPFTSNGLIMPSCGYGSFMAPSCCSSNFMRAGLAMNLIDSVFNSISNSNNSSNSNNFFNPFYNNSMNFNYMNSYMPYMMPSFNFCMPSMTMFRMPSFNFVMPDFSKIFSPVKRADSSFKINTKSKLPQLEDINYDEKKAKDLVSDALGNAKSKPIGQCAQYVKEAIQRVGLGAYIKGHAYACADILSKNPNFKEINVSGNDLKKLPAGCVIVYGKGDAGYSSAYGHIEITTGKGNAVSDFVNSRIKASDNARVFVPVSAKA